MASAAVEQIRDRFFAYYGINPDGQVPLQYDTPTFIAMWENFLYDVGSGQQVAPTAGPGVPAPSGPGGSGLFTQPQAQPQGWWSQPRPGQPVAPVATGPGGTRTSASPSGGL